LAQQHAAAHEQAQRREAEDLAEHLAQVAGRRFACEADAEAAIAEYAGRSATRRGRPVRRWHYHEVQYQVEAQWQRKQRAQRGRPPKGAAAEEERVYRLRVATQALAWPVETFGWLVLATTVDEQTCSDAEIMKAYRDQTTTVEPGFRWIKNPAAISPVWLEKPERIAALAMLTVVGLLVYGLIQRQVRQYLQQRQESMPGNKGETAMPTATVVFESFAPVMLVYLDFDGVAVSQVHGWQAHHQLICEALGGSDTWYEGTANRKNHSTRRRAP
jgi:transposase